MREKERTYEGEGKREWEKRRGKEIEANRDAGSSYQTAVEPSRPSRS